MNDPQAGSGSKEVEPEEEVLDGQHFDMMKASLRRIFSQGIGTHDRAGTDCVRIGHANGQAVQDARAIHHPFHIVAFGGERIANTFIHDENRASFLYKDFPPLGNKF